MNSGESVDTAALTAAITTAKNLVDNTATGTEPGQVSEGAKTALTEAIATAQEVADSSQATQQEVNVAVQELNAAIATFNEAIIADSGVVTTLKIENITGNTVNSGKQTYEIATTLLGLLSESNKQVLKGAVVKVKVEEGKITAISSLELNRAGLKGALVTLDGKNTTIPSLSINADFVQVKNLTVSGNVTVTEKVSNEFSANTLKVNGDLIIEASDASVASLTQIAAATTGPTTNLVNSSVTKVQVQRDGVVIVSDKKLPEVVVSQSVKTIQIDADVTKVTINAKDVVTVNGEGTIDEFIVTNTDAKVEFGITVKIKNLILPKGVKPESVISNYNQVKKNIAQIQDTEGKPISVGTPGGGGASGGSGPVDSGDTVDTKVLSTKIDKAKGK